MAKLTEWKKVSRVRCPGMDIRAHLQDAALYSFWNGVNILYLAGKDESKAWSASYPQFASNNYRYI